MAKRLKNIVTGGKTKRDIGSDFGVDTERLTVMQWRRQQNIRTTRKCAAAMTGLPQPALTSRSKARYLIEAMALLSAVSGSAPDLYWRTESGGPTDQRRSYRAKITY